MTGRLGDWEVALSVKAVNGESPMWDDRRGLLWWVDMRKPALNAFDPATGGNRAWETPSWIGCYAVCKDGCVVVALRDGLARLDPGDGSLRPLVPAPLDSRRFCLNDGCCNREGRHVVGPMHHPLGPDGTASDGPSSAPLMRFDPERGGLVPLPLPPVTIANGSAFSPDGRTFYHCDTVTKTIWASDYDVETGEPSNPRVFARVDEGGDDGGPDGAVVDSEGFYLCAVFGGGCLLRFDPSGRLERRIVLPVDYPTKPALGGPDRRTLYVTTASFPIKVDPAQDHPWTGCLLALEAPAPGPPSSYMRNLPEPRP